MVDVHPTRRVYYEAFIIWILHHEHENVSTKEKGKKAHGYSLFVSILISLAIQHSEIPRVGF